MRQVNRVSKNGVEVLQFLAVGIAATFSDNKAIERKGFQYIEQGDFVSFIAGKE
jgi:hypothetical protein